MSVIKNISLEDKIETIKQFAEFMQLDHEPLMPLVPVAACYEFMRGDLIFREHDASKFLYIVQKGRVKCFKQSGTGKTFVAYVASCGGSLNGIAVFSGLPHFLSAQAIEGVTLLRIKREDYVPIVIGDPKILFGTILSMEQALRSAYDRLIDAVGERASQRVCDVLYMLRGKFGPELQFSGEEIGELSGTTTETTIRILSTLKQRKIIHSDRRKIRILNDVELKNMSHFPEHSPGRA
ncbi:MAG TPA: Crp/Fnr family transcriptional regulator [Syntrophorhabdaceae bacterium]|nr:Crp/Fnr family transcriptional regulator [Syntrophorhabdaceae bacterium]